MASSCVVQANVMENILGEKKDSNLTMVPFDWDAIDRKYMTDRDISLLNEYHSEVYKRISPYLDEDEKAWLREKTMPR